jgi:hypothetical protein
MEVNQPNIDKAFRLAFRASEDFDCDNKARAIFKAIAHQIWLACGVSRPTEQVLAAIKAEQSEGQQTY